MPACGHAPYSESPGEVVQRSEAMMKITKEEAAADFDEYLKIVGIFAWYSSEVGSEET